MAAAWTAFRADLVFLKTLLSDWSVRTANPHEANLFFLPAFATFHGGHVAWQQGAAGGDCSGIAAADGSELRISWPSAACSLHWRTMRGWCAGAPW